MRCKAGDLAKIVFSIRKENIGRIVKVVEYIGSFDRGDKFQFRSLPCQCAITDHYWWVEAEDLSIMFGPSPRAYIPDSWLEPIRPDKELNTEKTDKEIDYDMVI